MKSKKEYREQFLQKYGDKIKNANMTKIAYLIEKAVKTKNPKLLDYENIVSIGARKTGESINKEQFNQLLEHIYEFWIENNIKPRLKTAKYDSEREQLQQLIDEFDEYKKDKTDFDIYDFWVYQGDRWLGGIKSPIYYQGRYFCHFYTNVMSTDRFEFEKQCYDARIYLNVKIQNSVELAKIFVDKALQKNVPLTFKIAFFEERNDNFVIYGDYQYLDSIVQMIEETKKENPQLFEGCKVKNPLMATLGGYMGFGEEPFSFGSYNSIRTEIMEYAYRDLVKQFETDPTSLTQENIQQAFELACEKNHIDSENFYLNKLDKYFSYDR